MLRSRAALLHARFALQRKSPFEASIEQKRKLNSLTSSLSSLSFRAQTGKTRTVVGIISALLLLRPRPRILLTAPSHAAIDEARSEIFRRFAPPAAPRTRATAAPPSRRAHPPTVAQVVARLLAGAISAEGLPVTLPPGAVVRVGLPECVAGSVYPATLEALVDEDIRVRKRKHMKYPIDSEIALPFLSFPFAAGTESLQFSDAEKRTTRQERDQSSNAEAGASALSALSALVSADTPGGPAAPTAAAGGGGAGAGGGAERRAAARVLLSRAWVVAATASAAAGDILSLIGSDPSSPQENIPGATAGNIPPGGGNAPGARESLNCRRDRATGGGGGGASASSSGRGGLSSGQGGISSGQGQGHGAVFDVVVMDEAAQARGIRGCAETLRFLLVSTPFRGCAAALLCPAVK